MKHLNNLRNCNIFVCNNMNACRIELKAALAIKLNTMKNESRKSLLFQSPMSEKITAISCALRAAHTKVQLLAVH